MNSQQNLWLPQIKHPVLEIGETDVWRIYLSQNSLTTEALFNTLSTDERQRASRYFHDKDRQHFVVARGALREILGGYLQTPPNRIEFSYNKYGKPKLISKTDGNSLCFNLAHSRELALVAVTQQQMVGVDIEFIDNKFANLEVAERFFSPTEVKALKALPAVQQTAAFFSCWTRKEAYIKAVGEGLSHPLQQFSVSITPEDAMPSLTSDDVLKDWSLRTLYPSRFYTAALAVEGSILIIRCRQWSKSHFDV